MLDYVPVVGAVKNGIEAVIHLSNDNNEECASKAEQAIFSGVLDIATFGVGGTIAKVGGKAVAKVATKLMAKETGKLASKAVIQAGVKVMGTGVIAGAAYAATCTKIKGQSFINEFNKGGNKTQTQTNSSSKQDTKENQKKEKGKKDEDEPQKNPDKDDQKKGGNGNGGPNKKEPKRGDHVINNAILSLYGDIIETFLLTQGLKYRDVINYLPQEIRQYHDQPLPVNVMQTIESRLVVHVEGGVQGTNAETYGIHSLRLISSTVRYMQLLMLRVTNRLDARLVEIRQQENMVRAHVNLIIDDLAFVDEFARVKLPDDKYTHTLYDEAKKETIAMLKKLIELAKVWVEMICTETFLKNSNFSGIVAYLNTTDNNGIHHLDPSWKN